MELNVNTNLINKSELSSTKKCNLLDLYVKTVNTKDFNYTNEFINIRIDNLFNQKQLEFIPLSYQISWKNKTIYDIYKDDPILGWLDIFFVILHCENRQNEVITFLSDSIEQEYNFGKMDKNDSESSLSELTEPTLFSESFDSSTEYSLTSNNSIPINIPPPNDNIFPNYNHSPLLKDIYVVPKKGFENYELSQDDHYVIMNDFINNYEKINDYIFEIDSQPTIPKELFYLSKYIGLNIECMLDKNSNFNYEKIASDYDWTALPLLMFCQKYRKKIKPPSTILNQYISVVEAMNILF